MASGSGQAEAAGPHLPSALGPLTPNAARVTVFDNSTVGEELVAKDVGDIKMRAEDYTEHADTSGFAPMTHPQLMPHQLMSHFSPLPSVGDAFPSGAPEDFGRGKNTPCSPRGAR